MLLLQCGSKNMMERILKLTAMQNKKNKGEYIHLADPLGTACGPSVEIKWDINLHKNSEPCDWTL
jgi:hypothetical protein